MTRKTTLLFLLAAGTGWLTLSSYNAGPGIGGAGDLSTSGCGGVGCHSVNSATIVQDLQFTDLSTGQPISNGQYIPGHTYTVTLFGSNASSSLTHFGFQTTARNGSNQTVGSITVTNTSTTHTYTASGRTGIEHSTRVAKNSGGLYTQSWRWTAPAAGAGTVTFRTAINAVDNNGVATTNDQSNIGSTQLTEGAASSVVEVSHARPISIYPNPAKENIRIDTRGWRAGNYHITILSSTGAMVMQKAVQHTGADELEIKLPELATGLYGVRILGNDASQSAPLFIR